jgi:Ecdysteroid kinase-like family
MSDLTAREKATLAARVLTVTAYAIAEHLPGERRAVRLADVPRSAEALTPEWLTAALCRDEPGARVLSFEVGRGSDGTSNRRAVRVTYNQAGSEAGLPTDLFTKTTATLRTRLTAGLANMPAGEAAFYNRVRPTVELDSPAGYYAAHDPRTLRSIIITEDVVVTRGATFGDTAKPASRTEAEAMVAQMARYHAAYWNSPRLTTEFGDIATAEDFLLGMARMINFEHRSLIGLERARDVVPPDLLRRQHDLWPALLASMTFHRTRPQTILHQDTHPGNWFRPGTDKMALHDWQGLARGLWATDVAYAIASGLRIEDRRAWERDLLALYLEQLAEAGIQPPPYEEAFLDYRREHLHGLFFWLFPMGAGRFQPDMQPRDEMLADIERTSHAAADLDTLDALTHVT